MEIKGFFQFEIIINVLDVCAAFDYLCYGHYQQAQKIGIYTTLVQHCINVIQMFRVSWVIICFILSVRIPSLT